LNTTSATVEKWEGQLQKDQVRRPAKQNKTESFLDKTAGRMKQIIAYILLFLGFVSNLQAQMAMDTIRLPEVKLIESRIQTHSIGSNVEVISSELIGSSNTQNLADFLAVNTAFYIKQYGSLATPSFRGTSSSHTLVLWNGIPLNSLANGLMDFSILPIANFKSVTLVHGGDGSVFGSGAMGGSIHFSSAPDFKPKKEIKLSNEVGSFGLHSNAISLEHTQGDFSFYVNLNTLTDANTFEFVNTTQIGHPLQINNYGKIASKSGQMDFAYRYDNRTQFMFNYWASNNDREVTQNMTTPFSDAKQYDNTKNILFSSKHKFSNGVLVLKQAHLEEDFRYTELLKNIDSRYLAKSNIMDADLKLYKGSYLFNTGANFTRNSVINNNYVSAGQYEKEFAVFSALQYRSDFLSVNTIVRKEWQTTFKVPVVPTLAFGANLSKYLKFRAKYNMNFRSPTFNDRFWAGAGANGNPDLVPENGWNKEFGFDFNSPYFNLSATAYNLDISDMILWQQMENGSWMPNNIKQVWSRGLETKLKIQIKDLCINGNYAYTKSTNELATDILDNTVGKQLRYVPLHKGNINFIITENDFQFSFNQSYTGEVITTYGALENKTLDAFILTDISIKYSANDFPISIEGKVKNLMNKNYQTYQNYPNPGRELLLTINYTIK
jgi:vitamin B12 transporter